MPRHVDRCNHITRERRETSAHPGWAQGSFFKFFLHKMTIPVKYIRHSISRARVFFGRSRESLLKTLRAFWAKGAHFRWGAFFFFLPLSFFSFPLSQSFQFAFFPDVVVLPRRTKPDS